MSVLHRSNPDVVPPAPTSVANNSPMQRVVLLWTSSLATLMVGGWIVCPQGQYQYVITAFDRVGLGLAHALRGEMLDHWMSGMTWFGSLAVLLPLALTVALVLLRDRRWREAGFLLLALLGSSLLSHLTKLVVMRPRPDLFPVWTAMPADWSYPSAHTMQITAAAVAMILVTDRRRALLTVALGIVVLLVGLSRLYLQVHFPSDVLAGTLAAALWVVGLHALMFGRPSRYDSLKTNGAHA